MSSPSNSKAKQHTQQESQQPTRRQREGETEGKGKHSSSSHSKNNKNISLISTSSVPLICDSEIVNAVKTQMIPIQQYRSDVVDVRNNELGVKECHIVAALLGNSEKNNGVRAVMPVFAKKKVVVVDQQQDQQQELIDVAKEQPQEYKKIPHFFERVHTMRLQLGSSILPSHRIHLLQEAKKPQNQNQKQQNKVNLNNLQCEGGFDVILAAIEQFHSPYLRRLDLSRNRFFTRHSEFREAIATRQKEISLFTTAIVSCKKLVILCLSHNVNLRSDGAVAICRDVVCKLPSLRALLMQRCSIDDTGAVGIAQLFAQGKLPAIPEKISQKPKEQDDDDNDESESSGVDAAAADRKGSNKKTGAADGKIFDDVFSTQERSSYSVLLTLDLSENRIGPNGLIALRKAIPDCVGLGCERQSPPMLKPNDKKQKEEKKK